MISQLVDHLHNVNQNVTNYNLNHSKRSTFKGSRNVKDSQISELEETQQKPESPSNLSFIFNDNNSNTPIEDMMFNKS